jgi:hypothetical protein
VNPEFLIAAAAPGMSSLWFLSGILLIVSLGAAIVAVIMARRYFQHGSSSQDDIGAMKPRSDNPTAPSSKS